MKYALKMNRLRVQTNLWLITIGKKWGGGVKEMIPKLSCLSYICGYIGPNIGDIFIIHVGPFQD